MRKKNNVKLLLVLGLGLLLTNTLFATAILNHKTLSFSFEPKSSEPNVDILYKMNGFSEECPVSVGLYEKFDSSNIDLGDFNQGESKKICFLVKSDTDDIKLSTMFSITPAENIGELNINIPVEISSGNTFGDITFDIVDDAKGITDGEVIFGIIY